MKQVKNWLLQFLVFIPALAAYLVVLMSNEAILYGPASFILGLYIWAGAGAGLAWLADR